jgi:ABC-2 type transport system permease protein
MSAPTTSPSATTTTGRIMSTRITLATGGRVLSQLRHDHRTLALLIVVPCVLMTLLAWIFDGTPTFDQIGAPLLGVFPFVVMFLVTSVATLRERTSGTLERLLTMPIGKLDLLVGYALAFGLLATVQAVVVTTLSVTALGLDIAGPLWLLLLVAVLDAVLGMALGLFVSAFAATEFQAVQFMPAFVLPQFLLCGLLVPRDELDPVLHAISNVLPLSYAVDAMRDITTNEEVDPGTWVDLSVVALAIVLALGIGAATLRRRTP